MFEERAGLLINNKLENLNTPRRELTLEGGGGGCPGETPEAMA